MGPQHSFETCDVDFNVRLLWVIEQFDAHLYLIGMLYSCGQETSTRDLMCMLEAHAS